MLYTARLPKYLQGKAVLAAIYIYTRSPYTALGYICPLKKKEDRALTIEDIDKIRVFRSIIYYKNKTPSDKLDVRAYKGIIIGYKDIAYKIQDYSRKKVVILKDITILENNFLKDNKTFNFNTIPSINKIPDNYLHIRTSILDINPKNT